MGVQVLQSRCFGFVLPPAELGGSRGSDWKPQLAGLEPPCTVGFEFRAAARLGLVKPSLVPQVVPQHTSLSLVGCYGALLAPEVGGAAQQVSAHGATSKVSSSSFPPPWSQMAEEPLPGGNSMREMRTR